MDHEAYVVVSAEVPQLLTHCSDLSGARKVRPACCEVIRLPAVDACFLEGSSQHGASCEELDELDLLEGGVPSFFLCRSLG
jgi:hypothetical protein